jgi:hypothetical protein
MMGDCGLVFGPRGWQRLQALHQVYVPGAALASAASPEARTLVHNLPSFADEPEVKSIIVD